MSGAPAVAMVTLSFNQARFLGECLDSVLAQRAAGLEYVVVDPGSTDGSRDLLRRREAEFDRLILEADEGPADGLNKGFAATRAPILGYLNSDDRLAPGALAFVRDWFERHPEADVLCGAIRIIDRDGRPSRRARTADAFDVARYVTGVCTVGQQATFFRRSAFRRSGGFNRANRIAWDGELLVDMALAGCRFATVDRVLGDFRIYGDSITGSERYRQRLDAYRRDLEARLRTRQVPLHSPAQARVLRLAYRCNPLRHLRYLMVR